MLHKGVILSDPITEKKLSSLHKKRYVINTKEEPSKEKLHMEEVFFRPISKLSFELEIKTDISISKICSKLSKQGIEITDVLPKKQKLERLLSEITQNRALL